MWDVGLAGGDRDSRCTINKIITPLLFSSDSDLRSVSSVWLLFRRNDVQSSMHLPRLVKRAVDNVGSSLARMVSVFSLVMMKEDDGTSGIATAGWGRGPGGTRNAGVGSGHWPTI